MYAEYDLLPISALQHLSFCERQWGLIYLEQAWAENQLTVQGDLMHNRADESETEIRLNLRITRGLRLRSLKLGIVGRADVIEFHRTKKTANSVVLEGAAGRWTPLIVEYKRGRPKIGREDEVQLCAQAMCLEEMLETSLTRSTFFYGLPRRRYDVVLDEELRANTESMIQRLHQLTNQGKTPVAEYSKKCRACSLVEICLPRVTGKQNNIKQYLQKVISEQEEALT